MFLFQLYYANGLGFWDSFYLEQNSEPWFTLTKHIFFSFISWEYENLRLASFSCRFQFCTLIRLCLNQAVPKLHSTELVWLHYIELFCWEYALQNLFGNIIKVLRQRTKVREYRVYNVGPTFYCCGTLLLLYMGPACKITKWYPPLKTRTLGPYSQDLQYGLT